MIRRFLLALIAVAALALVFAPFAHAQTPRPTRTRNVVQDGACPPDTGWVTRPGVYTSATAATAAARTKLYCAVFPPKPPVDTQPTPPPVVVPPVVTPGDTFMLVPNSPEMIAMGQPAVFKVPKLGPGSVGSRVPEKFFTGEVAPYQPGGGDFRTVCQAFAVRAFDRIVYPGRDTVGHVHLYFGNFGGDSISTCYGGSLNRSAYWVPLLYDTRTAIGILPDKQQLDVYYKPSFNSILEVLAPRDTLDARSAVQPFPKGLRLIAGNKASTGWEGGAPNYRVHWFCNGAESFDGSIPACAPGSLLELWIAGPQCWDGKNLDSPDHQSHMAYMTYSSAPWRDSSGVWVGGSKCPATHPVQFAQLTQILKWTVPPGGDTRFYRLTSDGMVPGQKAGQSAHFDYWFFWELDALADIIRFCTNGKRNCGVNLTGNGFHLGYLGKVYWP